MAYLTTSRKSRNVPNSGAGIPELPGHPLGWRENGKASGMTGRVEFELLLKAAMRACDHFGDGPEARAEMSRQCLNTPPHLRVDLLDHFRAVYGGSVVDHNTRPAAGQQPGGP